MSFIGPRKPPRHRESNSSAGFNAIQKRNTVSNRFNRCLLAETPARPKPINSSIKIKHAEVAVHDGPARGVEGVPHPDDALERPAAAVKLQQIDPPRGPELSVLRGETLGAPTAAPSKTHRPEMREERQVGVGWERRGGQRKSARNKEKRATGVCGVVDDRVPNRNTIKTPQKKWARTRRTKQTWSKKVSFRQIFWPVLTLLQPLPLPSVAVGSAEPEQHCAYPMAPYMPNFRPIEWIWSASHLYAHGGKDARVVVVGDGQWACRRLTARGEGGGTAARTCTVPRDSRKAKS